MAIKKCMTSIFNAIIKGAFAFSDQDTLINARFQFHWGNATSEFGKTPVTLDRVTANYVDVKPVQRSTIVYDVEGRQLKSLKSQ